MDNLSRAKPLADPELSKVIFNLLGEAAAIKQVIKNNLKLF